MNQLKNELKNKGFKFIPNKIALHIIEGENYYSVCYDYMGTGIHLPINEVDEDEFRNQGIRIWKTWSYKNE